MDTLPHTSDRRRRLVEILIHVLLVLILCILPEMLMRMAMPEKSPATSWMVFSKSGIMILVFYFNYLFLIDYTTKRSKRWWWLVAWNIVIVVGCALAMHYAQKMGQPHGAMRMRPEEMNRNEFQQLAASASFILRDIVMLILTVSLAVALKMSSRWVEVERSRRELIATQRESELENLRNQLNPHFLFNTLNTIYALIEIDQAEAQRAIHELSRLLRYVVYENPERVELSRELEFVQHYVELMRLRMSGDAIQLNINVSHPEVEIAPMLIMTLIENAFKHGNTGRADQPIQISITADDSCVECETHNYIAKPSATEQLPGGIGLNNLERRIELIYGDNASLSTNISDNMFHAHLKINLK